MASWDNDPVVAGAAKPWESDPVVQETNALHGTVAKGIGLANAFRSGVTNTFIPGLLGMPVQTIENMVNLSRGLTGTVAGMLGYPDMMPSLVSLPGNTESARKGLSALGLTVDNPDPASFSHKTAERVGSMAPSLLIPGSRLGQTTLAAAGSLAGEELGGQQGAMIGAMLPAAVSSPWASARQPILEQRRAANAMQDQTAAAARKEGLTIPPVETNPGSVTNQVLQGLVSGKARTEMIASSKNQAQIDAIVKRELGMPATQPLNYESLAIIRDRAGNAYQAIKDFGAKNNLQFKPDTAFISDINALGGSYRQLVNKFPELARNDLVDTLKTTLSGKNISPTEGIELIKKLRYDASKNYKNFDDPQMAELATAQKQAAQAVEGLIERRLAQSGRPGLVNDFREARTLIAKSYDAEAALVPGGGHINPRVLSKAYKDERQVSGGIKTIAEATSAFPSAFRPPNPAMGQQFSLWDTFAGGGLGSGLLATGNPTTAAAAFSLPLLRLATREGILSGPYQRTLGTPSYAPALSPDNSLGALLRGYVQQ